MCRRFWGMCVQCGSVSVGRCGECVCSVVKVKGRSDGVGNVCAVWKWVGRTVWGMCVQCGSGSVGRCGECVWSVEVGRSDGVGNECGVWKWVGR
ncbi:hypothetical protein HNY73_008338 [Argiope bruennichi]|uniref:Uncharacterized protein n=1 Tax=Argiope bruennichi TaxID=94029 RepID=A0A8T0F720_ARGBR|nr:hypothetical protein HNY73_008338 [Argiope bruennichi]